MRKLIIIISILILAAYLYLFLVIEHDKRWFQNFSQSTSNSNDSIAKNQNSNKKVINDDNRLLLGENHARRQVKKFLTDTNQFTWDTLIRDKEKAIAIVEPILFEKFGKEQILSEKPYEVYLINGYWYLCGTIPKGSKGGGFEIIISAKNAQIIRLTHYK